MKKSLLVLSFIVMITIISIPSIFADNDEIPSWVRGVAAYWVQEQITDTEFIEAIEFLVEQKIINLPNFQKIPPLVILDDSPIVESIQVIEEEPEPLIHVTTNKKSYQSGDTIIIRGTVTTESQDIVTTTIASPAGNIVNINQIIPNNGVFQSIFKTGGGTMDSSGEYQVRVQQGSEKNYITFNFVQTQKLSSTSPSPVEVDSEPEPEQ